MKQYRPKDTLIYSARIIIGEMNCRKGCHLNRITIKKRGRKCTSSFMRVDKPTMMDKLELMAARLNAPVLYRIRPDNSKLPDCLLNWKKFKLIYEESRHQNALYMRDEKHLEGFIEGAMEVGLDITTRMKSRFTYFDDVYDLALFKIALSDSLSRLSETQRQRFMLYYAYGFNYKEIAEHENVSIASVQRSVKDAIRIIQKNNFWEWGENT